MDVPAPLDPLLDTASAAAYLGGAKPLSERTLERWRCEGCGPAYLVVGGKCIRYRRSDLNRFLSEGVRSSTSDPGINAGAR
jgi:hypothetical protein